MVRGERDADRKMCMSLVIRKAEAGDAGLIYEFIRELAAFEKLTHEVDASQRDIEEALFGPQPRVFAEIAEWNGTPAGFALWFYNFSTFRGRHGLYLEDLFVAPGFPRQRGREGAAEEPCPTVRH